MKKNIISLFLLSITSVAIASNEVGEFLQSLDHPLWRSTEPLVAPDPALSLSPFLNTLPYTPSTSTFFFSRIPSVTRIDEVIDTRNSLFDTYRAALHAARIQEHTIGLQLGQQLQEGNWELLWNWWVGLKERNLWIPGSHETELNRALTQTHMLSPREIHPWECSKTHAGIGDLHLIARYNLHLGKIATISLGVQGLIAVGTKQQVHATEELKEIPLDSKQLTAHIFQRAQDILLASSFSALGSHRIGINAKLALHLGQRCNAIFETTFLSPTSTKHDGYDLDPLQRTTGSQGSNDIATRIRIREFLLPYRQTVTYKEFFRGISSAQLTYQTHNDIHYAIGLQREEVATSATKFNVLTQQCFLLASKNSTYHWGSTATYLTGHYTFDGTYKDGWSIGIGMTVQA